MQERIYKKGDQEYINNGHYTIEGEEWMTLWAFKKKFELAGNNEDQNSIDTSILKQGFTNYYKCIPDFGNGERHMFSIEMLKEKFEV